MRIGDNLTYHPGPSFPDPAIATPQAIREFLASVLAPKDVRQRAAIRHILERLRQKLPAFEPGTENFVDLYPIHPSVFNALFELRSLLPGFSALRFMQKAIPTVLDRPEDRLVTLDHLFDSILPELGKVARVRPLLASYESFHANVLPLFKPGVQPKVEAILKAIAFSTICQARPVDAQSLANSLLLYEDSDFLPSYSLTSALLMEMEQKGGMHLVAEGEKFERAYRLLDLVQPVSLFISRERLESEEELRRKFPLLICDWIRSEIPIWKPDFSSKYETSSQSLVAPIPEGENRPAGLLYFKSVYDPFWSEDDFQMLDASRYPWILLILSPLERSFGTNSMLGEFATRSKRMLIWCPDKPSRAEVERLHESVSFCTPLGIDRSGGTSFEKRNELRRILRALYVERGQFVTSSDQWPIGAEIEGRTLAQLLAMHLTTLAALAPERSPEEMPASQPVPAPVRADDRTALRITVLLTGLEEREARDSASARRQLLEWWDLVRETETRLLSARAQSLPDSFLTTHFWREVRLAGNLFQMIKPILESLRRGETALGDALEQVLRQFGGDENRLREWGTSLQNLTGLVHWLPGFERAKDYIVEAFPLGHKTLDQQRASLQDSIARPQLFLQPSEREKFDSAFLEFKSGYTDYYHSVHDEALNIVSASKEAERKVVARNLQNLELLSNLLYTDKSYLNRVRILGKWILRNQCLLPVREILERYPRCYCNFNPAGNRELAESAAQINALIEEGVEYFRSALRTCSKAIIEDLRTRKVDDFHSKQIAALLSHGPMVSLKPMTIEILNRIIENHSADFLSATSYAKKSSHELP
jgi:hypothetical protein